MNPQLRKLALDMGPLFIFFVAFELLRIARVRFGVAAMFLYVGAEVAIGSLLVNYLSLPFRLWDFSQAQ